MDYSKNGMACRIQEVVFTKEARYDATIRHRARIIMYPNVKMARKKDGTENVISVRLVSLLTNDID